MISYTSLPPKIIPLPREAGRVSLEKHISFTYKGVDQEAMASLFNLPRPLGTITAGESLKRSLYKTL